jgi:hypothetical protein
MPGPPESIATAPTPARASLSSKTVNRGCASSSERPRRHAAAGSGRLESGIGCLVVLATLAGRARLDHLPREVFFFLTLTGFPVAAACFCFFLAAISDLLVLAGESFM